MASWRACATREATRRRYRCREEGASPSPSHSGRCMVGPRPHSGRVGDTDYPRRGGLAGVDCAGQRQSRPGAGAVRRSLQTAAWDILHPGRLARLRNRSQQFQSPPIRGVSQDGGKDTMLLCRKRRERAGKYHCCTLHFVLELHAQLPGSGRGKLAAACRLLCERLFARETPPAARNRA